MTLSKLPDLSETQFSHLSKGNNTYLEVRYPDIVVASYGGKTNRQVLTQALLQFPKLAESQSTVSNRPARMSALHTICDFNSI